MTEGLLLYDILSTAIGLSATLVLFLLYRKTRDPKLLFSMLTSLFLGSIVAILTADAYDTVKTGLAGQTPLWSLTNFLILALCWSAPPLCRPTRGGKAPRRIERAFAGTAVVLGVIDALGWVLGLEAVRVWVYGPIYGELCLVLMYFAVSPLVYGPDETVRTTLHHFQWALTSIRVVTIALLPAFILVDFFGWLLPFMADWLPQGFFVLPAFYSFMSLNWLLGASKEILEPAPLGGPFVLPPAAIVQHGLSHREAELVPLLVEGLSYQEIALRWFVSVNTVRSHITHLYRKTGTRSRGELCRLLKTNQRFM